MAIHSDLGHDLSLGILKSNILLAISPKFSDCFETRNKYIYWMLGLKFVHLFWTFHYLDLELSVPLTLNCLMLYLRENSLIATGHKFWSCSWQWPFLKHICSQIYIRNGWVEYHKTKKQLINWRRSIRCEPDITDNCRGHFRCPQECRLLIKLCIMQIYILNCVIVWGTIQSSSVSW